MLPVAWWHNIYFIDRNENGEKQWDEKCVPQYETANLTRDGFEDSMFEANAKIKAKASSHRGQGQGQGQYLQPTNDQRRHDTAYLNKRLVV